MLLFWVLEAWVFVDLDPVISAGSQLESMKAVIQLNTTLATTFIGIATAVIGAVAYYIRSRTDEFGPLTSESIAAMVASALAAVYSIYFGHLVLVGMRNQLASGGFDPTTWAMRWAERLQFFALIVALVLFGLLVVDREATRKPAKKK